MTALPSLDTGVEPHKGAPPPWTPENNPHIQNSKPERITL
jgi:hypothetical protein